jgi:hypothetical protein
MGGNVLLVCFGEKPLMPGVRIFDLRCPALRGLIVSDKVSIQGGIELDEQCAS